MISDTGVTSGGIGRIVERQLRNWEIARSQKLDRPVEPRTQVVEHFVSVSRAVGLPGEQVAERLHERLGWPVFDREILHAMAGDDAYRERIYRELDEHDENWLDEFVRSAAHRSPRRIGGLLPKSEYPSAGCVRPGCCSSGRDAR